MALAIISGVLCQTTTPILPVAHQDQSLFMPPSFSTVVLMQQFLSP